MQKIYCTQQDEVITKLTHVQIATPVSAVNERGIETVENNYHLTT